MRIEQNKICNVCSSIQMTVIDYTQFNIVLIANVNFYDYISLCFNEFVELWVV